MLDYQSYKGRSINVNKKVMVYIKENAMLNDKTLISRSIDFENETTEEQRAIRDVMTLVKKQHSPTFITPNKIQKYDYNPEYVPADIIVTMSTPMDKYLILSQRKSRTALTLELAFNQL